MNLLRNFKYFYKASNNDENIISKDEDIDSKKIFKDLYSDITFKLMDFSDSQYLEKNNQKSITETEFATYFLKKILTPNIINDEIKEYFLCLTDIEKNQYEFLNNIFKIKSEGNLEKELKEIIVFLSNANLRFSFPKKDKLFDLQYFLKSSKFIDINSNLYPFSVEVGKKYKNKIIPCNLNYAIAYSAKDQYWFVILADTGTGSIIDIMILFSKILPLFNLNNYAIIANDFDYYSYIKYKESKIDNYATILEFITLSPKNHIQKKYSYQYESESTQLKKDNLYEDIEDIFPNIYSNIKNNCFLFTLFMIKLNNINIKMEKSTMIEFKKVISLIENYDKNIILNNENDSNFQTKYLVSNYYAKEIKLLKEEIEKINI